MTKRIYSVEINLRTHMLAETSEKAVEIVSQLLQDAVFSQEEINHGVVCLKPIAPLRWKKGMLVEYIRHEEWAWNKGTRGRITGFQGPEKDIPGADYQVFYVSPLNKDGSTDHDISWWTTPRDVCYIPEGENVSADG